MLLKTKQLVTHIVRTASLPCVQTHTQEFAIPILLPRGNHSDDRKAVHALLHNVFDLLCVGNGHVTSIDQHMRVKHGNVSIYPIARDSDVPDDSDILGVLRGGSNLSFVTISPNELAGWADNSIHNSLITSRHLFAAEPYMGLRVTWAID